MTPQDRDRLATVEQQMRDTRGDVVEIKNDLKSIVNTLAEARGGWKTLLLISGAAGAAGAIVSHIAPFLWKP